MMASNTLKRVDIPTTTVFAACVVITLAGSTVFPQFLSIGYLLQQLHVGSFLGIVAAGLFVVILLGHIDLSAPWTMTAAAVVATTINDTMGVPAWTGLPIGLSVGILVGLINGVGTVVFQVPSIIWTLAVNTILRGIIVFWMAQRMLNTESIGLIETMGQGKVLGLVSWAVLLWAAISIVILWTQKRSLVGRYLIAVGQNAKAAYLSGIANRKIVLGAFAFAGLCNALAGILLAGYAGQAYMDMGTPYLLPAIAAVVIGGSNILGGRGVYLGTLGGALMMTLLTSLLSISQMPEAVRQIIFGVLILGMVLVYSRRKGADS